MRVYTEVSSNEGSPSDHRFQYLSHGRMTYGAFSARRQRAAEIVRSTPARGWLGMDTGHMRQEDFGVEPWLWKT